MSIPQRSTRTFVFTDIEGSTRLLRALGDDYPEVLRAHDGIVRGAAAAFGGEAFGSEGDAQHLVFVDAVSAVRAAVRAQSELAAHPWPNEHQVRVRMGIHTGDARRDAGGFTGLVLHETARIASAGHGGQALLSPVAAELVRAHLPAGVSLRDLGEHSLKDVETPMRLYQLVIEGLEADFEPLRARSIAALHLPQPPTPFVGRDEVETAVRLTESSRLLTLTGPGGTGKTRLAIAVAELIAPRFPDGTWFVALDAVRDAGLVASEVATTLALAPGSGSPLERLVAYLGSRAVLLVLDNLEQVVDAGADIALLIRECPEIGVIATSRIPLRVYGEQEFPVPALPVPPADESGVDRISGYESVRLFEQRARAARPAFEVEEANAPAIADIVRRLDGLPLAIELAAARVRTLPIDALCRRLDDRLSLLTGGARDLPGRQQTLRGAIAWSHDLLDEPDRRLFARLGVIAGSAGLGQIEAIVGPADEVGREVFDGLESLAEQSLLRVADDGEEPRFGMLVTIREFARERLSESGEAAAIEHRHAEAFLSLAEEAAPALIGPEGGTANDRLERDHDDLRSALDWCVSAGDAELALRFMVAMWRFWQVRGHLHEATERIETVLAMPSVAVQPAALRSRAEAAAGGVAYWRSQWDRTRHHYLAALGLAREADDPALLAESLYNAGFAPPEGTGDWISGAWQSKPFFEEALGLYQAAGDQAGVARSSWALALAAAAFDEVDEAQRLARTSLEAARLSRDTYHEGWALHTLGLGEVASGDLESAAGHIRESLDMWADAGDVSGIVILLFDAALVARFRGREECSWQLMGAEERLRTETGTDIGMSSVEFPAIRFDRVPASDEQRAWFDEGMAMDTEEAVALAREVALGS